MAAVSLSARQHRRHAVSELVPLAYVPHQQIDVTNFNLYRQGLRLQRVGICLVVKFIFLLLRFHSVNPWSRKTHLVFSLVLGMG